MVPVRASGDGIVEVGDEQVEVLAVVDGGEGAERVVAHARRRVVMRGEAAQRGQGGAHEAVLDAEDGVLAHLDGGVLDQLEQQRAEVHVGRGLQHLERVDHLAGVGALEAALEHPRWSTRRSGRSELPTSMRFARACPSTSVAAASATSAIGSQRQQDLSRHHASARRRGSRARRGRAARCPAMPDRQRPHHALGRAARRRARRPPGSGCMRMDTELTCTDSLMTELSALVTAISTNTARPAPIAPATVTDPEPTSSTAGSKSRPPPTPKRPSQRADQEPGCRTAAAPTPAAKNAPTKPAMCSLVAASGR